MRTDVKKYYASIDHDRLLEILKSKIGETSVLSLLYQFMKRTVYKDGYYKTFKKGICRGTSLSSLLGALYLEELDVAMKNSSSFYIRYMNDIIVMSKNKWSFRRNIRKVNRILEGLNLKKAEDKTFIGKIEKGFDFLGFYFSKEGMSISKKAVRKFAKNIVLRLEEHSSSNEGKITPFRGMKKYFYSSVYNTTQQMDKNTKGDLPIPEAVSVYVQRWLIWVKSIYEKKNALRGTTAEWYSPSP